jgi:hypothetical protein
MYSGSWWPLSRAHTSSSSTAWLLPEFGSVFEVDVRYDLPVTSPGISEIELHARSEEN